VHDLKQWLEDRQSMLEHIQQNLQRAQNRMKHQADKNRQERTFQVGDWVYVKLQPYVQQSVNRRTNHKLSFKFFGPYLILQKVGPVAYKLQLPASSQIHPVIHVSQLKKALPPQVSLSDDNELNLLTLFHSLPPAQVLATRLQLVGRHAVPAALVQRQSCPPHWATWEPSSSLPPALSTSAPSTSRGRAVA
jgi:hypothetical protein